ncbi:hypothetical protein D3C87_2182630 [compost metagenome]
MVSRAALKKRAQPWMWRQRSKMTPFGFERMKKNFSKSSSLSAAMLVERAICASPALRNSSSGRSSSQ